MLYDFLSFHRSPLSAQALLSRASVILDYPNRIPSNPKGNPVPLQVLLVIEDNEDDLNLARRVIHHHNPTVAIIVYPDGEGALAYLKTPNNPLPDLILLDLGLPRMDGLEFLRYVRHRQRTGKTPIVVITGLERGAQAVAEAFMIGVDGYLLKPITSTTWKELLTKLGLDT